MQRRILVGLVLAGGLAATVLPGRPASADIEQIRDVIGHYFAGHATGDGSHFTRAFHPESKLFWVRDGQLQQRTSAAYIAGAPGMPSDDEARRKRRIVTIDVSGDAAVVKVELDYPGALIYDYMSMLKIEGRWQIINKTFVVHPRGE